MASRKARVEGEPPVLRFTSPSLGPSGGASGVANTAENTSRRRRLSRRNDHHERHVRLQAPSLGHGAMSPASSIYMGSYGHGPRGTSRSRSSLKTSVGSAPASPRLSMTGVDLEALIQNLDPDLETYGVEELRDGFFDATFSKPHKVDREDIMRVAEFTLPIAFQKGHPLSPKRFLPKQWEDIKGVLWRVTTTRAGIKLTKSFLAFFIAYILCLVPVISVWLGRYGYIMVLSTIINHPGRTIGAQLDGAVLTIMGSATGLGWGAFAIWLTESTAVAKKGYGGILAAFLVVFMGIIAALRSYYIRLYQFILCAGLAINYTCLADSTEEVNWKKLFEYGIPWLLGQAICLLVCFTVFPDAGSRPLAVSLHGAFGVMQEGLIIPQEKTLGLHRRLTYTFVTLSQAYRDLVLDISITRFRPSDVEALRNLMQAVIRSLLALRMETQLFDDFEERLNVLKKRTRDPSPSTGPGTAETTSGTSHHDTDSPIDGPGSEKETVIDIDPPEVPTLLRTDSEKKAAKLVAGKLADPTASLLKLMTASLVRCDAVLMGMSGYRKYLGPPLSTSDDILGTLTKLRKARINMTKKNNPY